MRAWPAGLLSSLLLLVLFVSASSAAPEPAIKVGVTASDAFAEVHYARELGLFKKAGLNVKITPFTTGAAVATGVSSGTVDVGVSNVALLARAVGRGEPFVFIAGAGMYSTQAPISALCVLKTSSLRQAKDLEGMTVAITAIGDQTQIGVSAWLAKNNVDLSKVHFIQIPFTEMHAALQGGLADAAIITEPWLSATLQGGDARILAKPYDAVAPQFLIGVWFTTSQWYGKNRDLANRFVKVIYETARWANAHRDLTAPMLASYAKLDVQTIRSMTRSPYSTSLDPSLIQPQLDLTYKFHIIDRPITASSLIAK
ncbi:MAG TPA: ABC transporter substrate-binding protein [Candidatus Acidoferrales bacterium]|nr:ABC transporter substrate-binding protein [Candidatus Acidoferrales bacterium]